MGIFKQKDPFELKRPKDYTIDILVGVAFLSGMAVASLIWKWPL